MKLELHSATGKLEKSDIVARIRVICQCQGHPTSYILAPLVIGRNGLIQAKIQTFIANLVLSKVVLTAAAVSKALG